MKFTDEMLSQFVPEAEKLWLDSLPPDSQIPAHTFSKRFEKSMQKQIRIQKRSPAIRNFLHFAKQTAAVFLLTSIIAFSALMTVDAYRAKFIEVVTEVFYDLTHYQFRSSQQQTTQLGKLTFSYLPDGLQETTRQISDSARETISFKSKNGQFLQVSLNLLTEDSSLDILLDTEDANAAVIPFQNGSATLIEKGETATLLWEDDTYTYLLFGDFSPEELLKIADGISVSK